MSCQKILVSVVMQSGGGLASANVGELTGAYGMQTMDGASPTTNGLMFTS